MAENGGIQLVDVFSYSGKRFIDLRQHAATLEELKATAETSIPDGFTKFCDETRCWYEWNSHNDDIAGIGKWRPLARDRVFDGGRADSLYGGARVVNCGNAENK